VVITAAIGASRVPRPLHSGQRSFGNGTASSGRLSVTSHTVPVDQIGARPPCLRRSRLGSCRRSHVGGVHGFRTDGLGARGAQNPAGSFARRAALCIVTRSARRALPPDIHHAGTVALAAHLPNRPRLLVALHRAAPGVACTDALDRTPILGAKGSSARFDSDHRPSRSVRAIADRSSHRYIKGRRSPRHRPGDPEEPRDGRGRR
jgi:hypothetical protein